MHLQPKYGIREWRSYCRTVITSEFEGSSSSLLRAGKNEKISPAKSLVDVMTR